MVLRRTGLRRPQTFHDQINPSAGHREAGFDANHHQRTAGLLPLATRYVDRVGQSRFMQAHKIG